MLKRIDGSRLLMATCAIAAALATTGGSALAQMRDADSGYFSIWQPGEQTVVDTDSVHRYRFCAFTGSGRQGEQTTITITADGSGTTLQHGYCVVVDGAVITVSSSNPDAGISGTFKEID